MALIYDNNVDDTFSVCVVGENGKYFVYLYKTGFRGTVYDSVSVDRRDSEASSHETQSWRQWAIDKIASRYPRALGA